MKAFNCLRQLPLILMTTIAYLNGNAYLKCPRKMNLFIIIYHKISPVHQLKSLTLNSDECPIINVF